MQFEPYAVRERDRLLRAAVLLGSPADRAEELARHALVALHRAWPRAAGTDDPGAVARRALLRRWRARDRDRPPADVPAPVGYSAAVAPGIAVRRFLATLDPDTRADLVSRLYADLPDVALPAGLPARLAADPEVAAILPPPRRPDEAWARDALALAAASVHVPPPDEEALRRIAEAPRRRWPVLVATAACLVALLGVAGWTSRAGVVPPAPAEPTPFPEGPPVRVVPGVEAATRVEARAFLEEVGLRPDFAFTPTCRHVGRVLDQRPAEGAELPVGGEVLVIVGTAAPDCPEDAGRPAADCPEEPATGRGQ